MSQHPAHVAPLQDGGHEKVTYSEWISARLLVDYGTPFTFEGRPYLKKIHDLAEPKILFRTGRQVEKTSSIAAKLVAWSCLRPGWKSLYVSPSQRQTRNFSHQRLDKVLNSPFVRSRYFDPQNCIAGSMEVMLPGGETISMEEIAQQRMIGLEVLCYSDKTKRLSTTRITKIHLNGRRRVGRLKLENGMSLVCTPDHRVWNQAHRWVGAERVASSKTSDPHFKKIAVCPGAGQTWSRVLEWEEMGEEEVFDITVSNDHSFVANGVVVHNCVDDVYEKTFMNGSTILLNYASTDGDRCRGISTDSLFLDEIQDMTSEVFPVVEETLSHAPEPFQIYAGTPKTLNNCMEAKWKDSTQCEWLISCLSCGEWIYQDEKVVRDVGPSCPKCGKLIDPQFGRWEPYGKPDAEFLGFRIPQIMVPWISKIPSKWKALCHKLKTFGQQEFYNEVLGLAHEKGANPLVESDLKKCCLPERSFYEFRPHDVYVEALYAGVDWGFGLGSHTVLSISGYNSGKLHLFYMKRFAEERNDPEFQVEEIARVCQRMGVVLVAADFGGGFAQNKSLQNKLAGHADVVQVQASGVKKRGIDYAQQSGIYTFNRTAAMFMLINAIKAQNIVLPRWEQFQEFAQEYTCIFEDYSHALRMIQLDHPADMPDDCFHSHLHSMLAARLAQGEKTLV